MQVSRAWCVTLGLPMNLAQEALVAAMEQWPQSGIPENPGAWLTVAAKRRAVDHFRRHQLLERKQAELGRELEIQQEVLLDLDAAIDDEIGDDLLRLIFTACHPVLSLEARLALTLRLLGGLSIQEIARAFLIAEPTIAQRIVRAKRALAAAHVTFEAPQKAEFAPRLASVLQVIYLIFNEGYAATSGEDWLRPGLCEDALRLGRILAELVPEEPEIHGLVALMEIQASRSRARVGPSGRPAPGSGPLSVAPAPDPSRSGGAESRGTAGWRFRSVCVTGRNCRVSCARKDC